ncbi:MAG: arylsulfatase, partial [Actinomycetia bacterium]|nr:arylsulfatase [Actinomycetes bacterium]
FAPVLGAPDGPATNRLQYFEQFGSRALVAEQDHTRWKAVAKHNQGDSFDDDRWELYDLSADYSECHDLAEANPQKLAELIDLWFSEAERHGVLPLDDRTLELFAARLDDRSPHPTHRRYHYRPPMSPIPAQAAPSAGGRTWDLTARVSRASGDEGVIWATGSANSGLSVFVQDDRLVLDYNAFDDHTIVESDLLVPVGDSTLEVRLQRTGRTTGTAQLTIDGEPCGTMDLGFMMRMMSSLGASLGYDHGSAVSARYEAPFEFSGTLHEVEISLGGRSKADTETTARSEMSRQ